MSDEHTQALITRLHQEIAQARALAAQAERDWHETTDRDARSTLLYQQVRWEGYAVGMQDALSLIQQHR